VTAACPNCGHQQEVKQAPRMAPPSCEETGEDFFLTLNGYDEIAVAKTFGSDVVTLQGQQPLTFLRALVFIHQRRDGRKDPDAKAAAMTCTLQGLNDYFADPAPEIDPDDPDTDVGKGPSLDG
jgi:hypothetical protein